MAEKRRLRASKAVRGGKADEAKTGGTAQGGPRKPAGTPAPARKNASKAAKGSGQWEAGLPLEPDKAFAAGPLGLELPRQKGRLLRFLALAAGILLAGALAALIAAWAVTAPRAGELIERETPPLPTVLGQTAEEVWFAPWPLYDILERGKAADSFAELSQWNEFFPYYFAQMGVRLPTEAAERIPQRMELTLTDTGPGPGGEPDNIFLRDYPAALQNGAPVLLQFAACNGSLSFLMQPAEPQPQNGERQAAALGQVRRDLEGYLVRGEPAAFAPLLSNLVGVEYCASVETGDGSDALDWGEAMLLAPVNTAAMLDIPLVDWYTVGDRVYQLAFSIGQGRTLALGGAEGMEVRSAPDDLPSGEEAAPGDAGWPALEEFLAAVNEKGLYSVQLITTPGQVVVVLETSSAIFGIYYDIQLERYSGVGMQYFY